MSRRLRLTARMGRALAFSYLGDLSRGRLVLALGEGNSQSFGDPSADPVTVRVDGDRFFPRLLATGDRELGESWAAGEWGTDNLPALVGLLLGNAGHLRPAKLLPSRLLRGARRLGERAAALARGRRPARVADLPSYRLTPDILETFLGPRLSLAAARFSDPAMTLAEAQESALARILAKARLRPEHHLLVAGNPRGGFAIETARRAGCRVTLFVRDRQQASEALDRAGSAGLGEEVAVLTGGLDEVSGPFDRIVVFEEELPAPPRLLLRQCDRLLTPRGIAVVRVVAAPAAYLRACARGGAWSRRRGFPGGWLPSAEGVLRAALSGPRLGVEGLENLAPHASRTLGELRAALSAGRERALALGADESALREWAWFLAWGEAAFSLRLAADLEVVLSRPGNPDLPSPPRRQF